LRLSHSKWWISKGVLSDFDLAMSSSRLTSRKRAEAAPGGVAQLTSRKRAKAAPGGVGSALALEYGCGHRLRQVRRAETVLGVYDVMRLACVEFRLDVSREVARQWLEICGSADPSAVALKILSAPSWSASAVTFCGPRGSGGTRSPAA
jgi:hypothetical protein